jgi:hypothetical protein
MTPLGFRTTEACGKMPPTHAAISSIGTTLCFAAFAAEPVRALDVLFAFGFPVPEDLSGISDPFHTGASNLSSIVMLE